MLASFLTLANADELPRGDELMGSRRRCGDDTEFVLPAVLFAKGGQFSAINNSAFGAAVRQSNAKGINREPVHIFEMYIY